MKSEGRKIEIFQITRIKNSILINLLSKNKQKVNKLNLLKVQISININKTIINTKNPLK